MPESLIIPAFYGGFALAIAGGLAVLAGLWRAFVLKKGRVLIAGCVMTPLGVGVSYLAMVTANGIT